jgi:hypothetical protein
MVMYVRLLVIGPISNGSYYQEGYMAAPLLPRDVTEHLEAAIQLSNRYIQLRLLEEAERLLSFQFPAAAIVCAGVVLEYLVASRDYADPNQIQQIEKWSRLRDIAVHSHEAIVSSDEAGEMVAGVRQLLLETAIAGPRPALTTNSNLRPERVRGKYKFVPTSSAEFITRKADELRLEHQ